MILAQLAEALISESDFPAAEAALKEALTASEHNDEHYYDAELYRLRGKL